MSDSIHFLLNDEIVETDAPSGLLLPDPLRKNERLVATKDGCEEGGCGARAVVIGELEDVPQIRGRSREQGDERGWPSPGSANISFRTSTNCS